MAGWRTEEDIFLVMWRSSRTGATLSDLRKSEAGKDRFVMALISFGIPREDITVVPQPKKWMPAPSETALKKGNKRSKREHNIIQMETLKERRAK